VGVGTIVVRALGGRTRKSVAGLDVSGFIEGGPCGDDRRELSEIDTIGSGWNRFRGDLIGLAPAHIFDNPLRVDAVTLNGGSGQNTFFVRSTAGVALLQVNKSPVPPFFTYAPGFPSGMGARLPENPDVRKKMGWSRSRSARGLRSSV
jgi:hypothetical protein